jgi:hypothetical protein
VAVEAVPSKTEGWELPVSWVEPPQAQSKSRTRVDAIWRGNKALSREIEQSGEYTLVV